MKQAIAKVILAFITRSFSCQAHKLWRFGVGMRPFQGAGKSFVEGVACWLKAW
jgi:hypothetical protein